MTESVEAARIEAQAEQFSTYIEMAEALSERQATVIRYYITLHTAMIGAGGAVFINAFDTATGAAPLYLYALLLLICSTGLAFCRLWHDTLRRLQYWEGKKYSIIRNIETEHAHLFELYAREWRESGEESRSSDRLTKLGGAEAKLRGRARVLALPAAFQRFYWILALLVLAAFALEIAARLSGFDLLNWLQTHWPGLAPLFTP